MNWNEIDQMLLKILAEISAKLSNGDDKALWNVRLNNKDQSNVNAI